MSDAVASYSISADKIADILPVFTMAKRVPLLTGRPGIAKTAFVRQGAVELGRRLSAAFNQQIDVHVRELHLASMSEVDVRGYLIPNGDQAVFTKPEFWAAVEQNPYGILFLDEFMQANHEVQKAVATLILERRIGEYQLPDGWSVVLAGNGLDDGAGANTLLSHIINRVNIINVTAPDVDVWCSWAAAEGLPFELIAFAKYRPDVVFNSDIPAAPNTPYCTPRSLHALGDIANAYPGGVRAMVDSPVGLALMTGAIGAGPASELAALVRTAINLPSYEAVVADPDGTMLPTKPDQIYAMTMLVAVRAKLEDAEQAVRYITRFQPNFAITGIISLVRRDKGFAASKQMMQWVVANRDMLQKFAKFISESM
jgi:hypothetical protein